MYLWWVDVLWGQRIKLAQVASTSELLENQRNDLVFFKIIPAHFCRASVWCQFFFGIWHIFLIFNLKILSIFLDFKVSSESFFHISVGHPVYAVTILTWDSLYNGITIIKSIRNLQLHFPVLSTL
jgi:hypothetical protein